MAKQVTELTFLDYFASSYGIPVPRHLNGNSEVIDIKAALHDWGGKALVKGDVLAGARGKAGAVAQVTNVHDALREIKRVSSLEINGHMTRIAYLVEEIPAVQEIYSAITYNTQVLEPSLTVSLKGGVNIEDVLEDEKITIPVDIYRGLDAYQAGEVLTDLGYPQEYVSSLSQAFISFWDLFISSGMEFAEINPWRITPQGKPYACDFKAVIDESP